MFVLSAQAALSLWQAALLKEVQRSRSRSRSRGGRDARFRLSFALRKRHKFKIFGPRPSFLLLQLPRSNNRIRSTQTEKSFGISQLAIAIHALGESPRTPFFQKDCGNAPPQKHCGLSSANSSSFPPPIHRLYCLLVDLGTIILR